MGRLTKIGTDPADYSARYRAYVLATLVLVLSLSFFDRILVGIAAPVIKSDLDLSDSELGLASGTAFALLYITCSLPLGWITDRVSRTWILAGSLGLWSGCTSLFGLGQATSHLVVARAGVGMGESGGATPAHSLLMDYFPITQRARVLAIHGFGVPLGVAGGAMIGGLLIDAVGWRATFVAAGLFGLAVALLLKLTVREPARQYFGNRPVEPQPFFRSIRIMAAKPAFLALCFGTACGSVVSSSKYFWLPSYFVRSFGLSLTEVGVVFGIIHFIAGISGSWIGGYLSDRIAMRDPRAPAMVTAWAYVASVPPLVGTLMAPNSTIAFIFYFAAALFGSFGSGPIAATTQYLASTNLRGTAASMLNFVHIGIGMGLGVAAIGILSDLLADRGKDSLNYALGTLPIFYILGALLFAFTARRMIRDAPPQTH